MGMATFHLRFFLRKNFTRSAYAIPMSLTYGSQIKAGQNELPGFFIVQF